MIRPNGHLNDKLALFRGFRLKLICISQMAQAPYPDVSESACAKKIFQASACKRLVGKNQSSFIRHSLR